MVNTPLITFIGAGNMAGAIIGGLIQQGYPADNITACDPYLQSLEKLARTTGIKTSTDNHEGVKNADVVILAVKPQVMDSVVKGLAPALSGKPLIISIAAGIEIASLTQWLQGDFAIIRCMPNTPALLQEGATAMYANTHTSHEQRQLADTIISAFGIGVWVETESQLDAVTALSGSGPAYFFLLIEAMQQAGESMGLPADIAKQLTQQTAIGAAKMAQASDVDVAELRRQVTSPNGTTEAAIAIFQQEGFVELCHKALQAAHDKSEILGKLNH